MNNNVADPRYPEFTFTLSEPQYTEGGESSNFEDCRPYPTTPNTSDMSESYDGVGSGATFGLNSERLDGGHSPARKKRSRRGPIKGFKKYTQKSARGSIRAIDDLFAQDPKHRLEMIKLLSEGKANADIAAYLHDSGVGITIHRDHIGQYIKRPGNTDLYNASHKTVDVFAPMGAGNYTPGSASEAASPAPSFVYSDTEYIGSHYGDTADSGPAHTDTPYSDLDYSSNADYSGTHYQGTASGSPISEASYYAPCPTDCECDVCREVDLALGDAL